MIDKYKHLNKNFLHKPDKYGTNKFQ